jgi:hypothetical protein
MTNALWMAAAGGVFAITVGVWVSVDVHVSQPPMPIVPTAHEIAREVTQQQSAELEASRQTAQMRKNAMRCGLPGYGWCP